MPLRAAQAIFKAVLIYPGAGPYPAPHTGDKPVFRFNLLHTVKFEDFTGKLRNVLAVSAFAQKHNRWHDISIFSPKTATLDVQVFPLGIPSRALLNAFATVNEYQIGIFASIKVLRKYQYSSFHGSLPPGLSGE